MKYYKKLDYLIARQKYFDAQREASNNASHKQQDEEPTETLDLLQDRSKLIDNQKRYNSQMTNVRYHKNSEPSGARSGAETN